jgi:hypothetical protein
VFEDRVLRRIFGPRRGQVTGGWRKLHNENLYNFHTQPGLIIVTESRGKRCIRNIEHMGTKRMHSGFWRESQKKRDHQEEQDVGGWMQFGEIG